MTCISNNLKTIKSCDFDTSCPKRNAGKPCAYCYVENARKIGFNAKKIYQTQYNNELLRMRQGTIDKLNRVGGLRLFSFGDYIRDTQYDSTKALLDHASEIGLQVKAITKQTDFIDDFWDHKAISVIHISIDNIGDGVDHTIAKKYRALYDKVLIRCVILKLEDLDALRFSDIFTFNHGNNGFHNFKKIEIHDLARRFSIENKICCASQNCLTCAVKCGIIK